MDHVGGLIKELAQIGPRPRATSYWAVIGPGFDLLIEHAADDENKPEPIPALLPNGQPGWWCDDHFTAPADVFAVTPNNPDGTPHENTAGYYTDAAMLAVYDPETRQRTGTPLATWPLIEGAHNHGDSTNPTDPAAPPPEPEGRHAQYAGDGAHVHRGGRHAHDVVTPPWLRPLQVGDRVIVERVAGSSWVVTHRPLPATVFLDPARATPSFAVGWKG